MIDRDRIATVFLPRPVLRPHFHDLAKAVFEREAADRFLNVVQWTDLIDLQLEDAGGHGIGPLLSIMPTDMAIEFLPAWLVIGLERPFPCDGVISALAANLDPLEARSGDEKKRFQTIFESCQPRQREVIAETLIEIAELNFRKHPDAHEQFSKIAAYWTIQECIRPLA